MPDKKLKQALDSDEDLMAFLTQEIHSDKYRELRKMAEQYPHPSEEALENYVLGWLSSEDEQIISEHICVCADCAGEVSGLMKVKEVLQADKKSNQLSELLKIVPGNIQDFFNSFFKPSIFIPVSVCLILIMIRLILPPSLTVLIAKSYNNPFIQEISYDNEELKDAFTLPWEKQAEYHSFSPSNRDAPAYQAFGAGMWTGRQILLKDNKSLPDFLSPANIKEDQWAKTQWSVYFHMGQWCFFVQTACLSDKEFPPEFWKQQEDILEKMQKEFEQ
ncbi:MAG: hypothetical protein GY749_07580, partial [Desulfobacteraceae bacterium]|nr:hypothetical protein [Desulfobacteraceae bacterium]